MALVSRYVLAGPIKDNASPAGRRARCVKLTVPRFYSVYALIRACVLTETQRQMKVQCSAAGVNALDALVPHHLALLSAWCSGRATQPTTPASWQPNRLTDTAVAYIPTLTTSAFHAPPTHNILNKVMQ
ncbi:unnamed protein product [Arctia plantaginis]|uniref:Uncharacterized protein n=1 Tax=Arctia plantaginis TaxID=874455 RepID=A0A8S1A1E2_ARCPL|nr:unnamed protein product [Arctia plantaginis]